MGIQNNVTSIIATKMAAMLAPVLVEAVAGRVAEPTPARGTPAPIVRVNPTKQGMRYMHPHGGRGMHFSKLTPDDVREIRAAWDANTTLTKSRFCTEQGSRYGVTRVSISNVLNGNTWRGV